jgi:hypothetical protein
MLNTIFPHSKLKDRMKEWVQLCFIKMNGQCIYCFRKGQISYCEKKLLILTKSSAIIKMFKFLNDNIFGGISCASFYSNITISCCSFDILCLKWYNYGYTRFLWGSCYSIFSFMCNFFVDRCLSFCTFSFGHCILLRFTDSDYPFGIFKLFLDHLTKGHVRFCFRCQLTIHILLFWRNTPPNWTKLDRDGAWEEQIQIFIISGEGILEGIVKL